MSSYLLRGCWCVLAVAACGGDDPGTPPLAAVPGALGRLAVNDASIFAIDTADGSLLELGLDGTVIGPLPTTGAVSEVAAAADWVAWVEDEGARKVIRRRRAGMIETTSTFAPHLVATTEGLFYSDTGLIALWADAVPERIATPMTEARLLEVDASYAYTLEAGAVLRYDRRADMAETLVTGTADATVRGGRLAYRTDEGMRLRDLFTKFDAIVGVPPASYACELLLAGRAVLCGKYRGLEGVTEELLADPVAGYTAVGTTVYWVSTTGGDAPTSAIRLIDAEQPVTN